MNRCLLCDQVLRNKPSWAHFFHPFNQSVCCSRCYTRFEKIDWQSKSEVIDEIHSLYSYNEAMMAYLHQYKFLQDVALAKVFARELRNLIKEHQGIVVPIPMHPVKKRERTFSHVDELLKAAQISYVELLEKMEFQPMSEKTREQRIAIQALFKLKEHGKIERSTYLLIDDIYTTGTTVHQAAKLLKQHGATNVKALTLIRVNRQMNGE